MPELYTSLSQDKVIKEAALRSGVSRGVMQACWDAACEVIKAWATEGHSVALPGLGTMRFGLRAKSVDEVNKVKANLITQVSISGPAGSTPTAESTLYSEAFTLSDTTTVKAIAVKNGTSSSVTTQTFTKGTTGGAPETE